VQPVISSTRGIDLMSIAPTLAQTIFPEYGVDTLFSVCHTIMLRSLQKASLKSIPLTENRQRDDRPLDPAMEY
jgi:hypothetical protein